MPELATDRLILRPLAPEDAEAHIAMMAVPEMAQYLSTTGKPAPREIEWRNFASYLGHWAIRGFGFFTVIERDTNKWVGRVGPWMPDGWPGLECGWAIAPAFWGRGYAPEAAIATINWTFETYPHLPRIISLIDPANTNSQAVSANIGETKTGETFVHPSVSVPLDIWGARREAWLESFGQKSRKSA